MTMEPHVLGNRDASTMGSAHTVVTEDVCRNRHKVREGAITLWAEQFPILRDPIADKVGFQGVATACAKETRKRRTATRTEGNALLCCKVEAPLPFSPPMRTDWLIRFWLEQTAGITFCCDEHRFLERLSYTCRREASSMFDIQHTRNAIKQVLPIHRSLWVIFQIPKIRLPQRARGAIWGKPQFDHLIHVFKEWSHPQFDNWERSLLFGFAPWDQQIGMTIPILQDAKEVEIARFRRTCPTVVVD